MKRILVVDDEHRNRRSLVGQLHQEFGDVEFLEARTVEGATKQILEAKQCGRSIDLGVVDLRLPKRGQSDIDGGFDVLNALRQTFPDSRALILTVRDDSAAQRKADEMNTELVPKPWNMHVLLTTVRRMLPGATSDVS